MVGGDEGETPLHIAARIEEAKGGKTKKRMQKEEQREQDGGRKR